MDNILATLLGSPAKAKLLRLFTTNPNIQYTVDELCSATRLQKRTINKELKPLLKIGLLSESTCTVTTSSNGNKSKNKQKVKNKKQKCFTLNKEFKYLKAVKQLVLNIEPADDKEILNIFKKVGKLKLLLLSGIFIHEDSARVDLLIVADKIKETALKRAISELETHLGQELRYVDFSTDEFIYRLGMYDRLLRDVLDAPHKILLDKLQKEWYELSMSSKTL